jgi:hypothetical protein
MQDSSLDTQEYRHSLDTLLGELKNQIDIEAHAIAAPVTELDYLDDYLLELNTFYYKNFHDRFFPHYEQVIKEDMQFLLHLSQDEAALKNNILAVLKHYALLFNRAKHSIILLERKRQETQALVSDYYKGNEERNVSLLYYLKELSGNWNSFLTLIRNMQVILKDETFISALRKYPANALAAGPIAAWNPENSRETREYNRLLAAWKLSARLLAKLADDPALAREPYEALVQEIKQADLNWDNRKVHPVVRTWYQQYIQPTYRLYLDSLNLYAEKRDARRLGQQAGQFGDWLDSLLIIIEQCMTYKSRGFDELACQPAGIAGIEIEYLQGMENYTSRWLQSIDELIQSLASSSRADYQNHSQRAAALLNISGERLREQLGNRLIPRSSILNGALELLKRQNDYLEMGIELLNDKEEHSVNARKQCRTILETLDSYMDLLTRIKDQLSRMLSPRQIKNTFADIDLKIEHVAIIAGASFPSTYRHLINEKLIETAVSDTPEGQILYDEGDIFVFSLDESIIYEIPKIIVAEKG